MRFFLLTAVRQSEATPIRNGREQGRQQRARVTAMNPSTSPSINPKRSAPEAMTAAATSATPRAPTPHPPRHHPPPPPPWKLPPPPRKTLPPIPPKPPRKFELAIVRGAEDIGIRVAGIRNVAPPPVPARPPHDRFGAAPHVLPTEGPAGADPPEHPTAPPLTT